VGLAVQLARRAGTSPALAARPRLKMVGSSRYSRPVIVLRLFTSAVMNCLNCATGTDLQKRAMRAEETTLAHTYEVGHLWPPFSLGPHLLPALR
jgi:hypothetical protein